MVFPPLLVLTQLLTDLAPGYVLSVVIFSTYFLLTNKFSTEGITFVSVALLVVYQGFAFSKPAAFLEDMVNVTVIAILSLTVMGQMIACTGVINRAAGLIVKTKHKFLIPIILVLVSYLSSAFVNNTPVVIILISLVSVFGRQIGIPNSRVMMPIAFAASLGGMLTIFGSSTNLLIYSKAQQLGTELGFFGFFYPALFIGICGIAYIVLLTFILPIRKGFDEQSRKFFFILNPTHGARSIFSSVGIREIKNILYNQKFDENLLLDEIIITEKSELVGLDILSSKVADYFDACAIGTESASGRIASGSRLLVVYKREILSCVPDEIVVTKNRAYILSHSNGLKVIYVFVGAIFSSGFLKVPLAVTVFTGLGFLTCVRAINVKEIFRSIEVKLLLMLIYSLTVGRSLETTGLLEDFTQFLHEWTYTLPLVGLIIVVFSVVTLLNEVMSNNAVGLIFAPVVLKLSYMAGIEAKYLLWTLIFAANSAFSTPFGYQVNLIVMESGKYRYSDYLRFGLPLNIIVLGSYLLYLCLFSELDLFHRVLLP